MKITWLFLLICVGSSCAERSRGFDVLLQIDDSIKNFRSEIPHGYSKDLESISQLVSDLKLDNLERGYYVSQIRFWLGHSMAKIRTVLQLKKKHDVWHCDLVHFSMLNPIGNDKRVFKVVEQKNDLFPKSGWEAFFSSVEIRNGIQLLCNSSVKDQLGCGGTDGMSYSFEIADSRNYKLLEICELDETYQRFVKKLESEFNFEYAK